LIYPGEAIDGSTAAAWGIADEAVAPEEVQDGALELARRLSLQAPLALRAAKRAIDQGLGNDITVGLALESALFAGLLTTRDAAIGLQSFIIANGPRQASFSGT
jgi:enoyl-CoA hydratase